MTRVFIGLENINPDNLASANKRQNKITEYRKMLLAWKMEGIMTLAGYILGFPADTPESIRRDIAIIQRELPLDMIEFFNLTPLPGSEDHQKLWNAGVQMEPDLNKYDLEHVCAPHPKMSKAEWEAIYQEAWSLYYSPEHMKTLLKRAAATGFPLGSLVVLLARFAMAVRVEKVHPLQDGILRLKHPSERRPGLPERQPLAVLAGLRARDDLETGRGGELIHTSQIVEPCCCAPCRDRHLPRCGVDPGRRGRDTGSADQDHRGSSGRRAYPQGG